MQLARANNLSAFFKVTSYISDLLQVEVQTLKPVFQPELSSKLKGKLCSFRMEIAKKGCHVIDPPFMPITDVVYVHGQLVFFFCVCAETNSPLIGLA